uniref:Uncharacterized protein n=1 Tax=Panagrolaimus sp. JU765 TaxID=591449 RepID=A0AC34QT76_9BILA
MKTLALCFLILAVVINVGDAYNLRRTRRLDRFTDAIERKLLQLSGFSSRSENVVVKKEDADNVAYSLPDKVFFKTVQGSRFRLQSRFTPIKITSLEESNEPVVDFEDEAPLLEDDNFLPNDVVTQSGPNLNEESS